MHAQTGQGHQYRSSSATAYVPAISSRMVNWSQLCTQQQHRPLWQKQQANYGGCIVAIVSFSACALFSGFWFKRWAKVYMSNFGLAGEERIWPGLGWFSGLMCVGSVVGAVAWGACLVGNALDFEPADSFQQRYLRHSLFHRYYAAFYILYGLEFLCFIVPKLMMLGRLTENSMGSSQTRSVDMDRARRFWHGVGPDGLRRRTLPMLFAAMAAAVVLCSVTGMVALDVTSAYNLQAADVYNQASASCNTTGNATAISLSLINDAYTILTNANSAASVQSVCEAIALMITALSYLVLVLRNVAIYRRAERMATSTLVSLDDITVRGSVSVPAVFADSDYTGAADATVQLTKASAVEIVEDTQKAAVDQRRRLVTACAIVLVSFPSRAAFDLLNAYSNFSDPYNPACGGCDACQSEQYIIQEWLNYTPEFQPIAVSLSSPLPMMWSLWLMMSAWERMHLRRGVDMNKTEEQRQTIAARARMGIDLPRPVVSVLFPWQK